MARKTNRGLRLLLWGLGLILLIGTIGGGITASKLLTPRPKFLDLPRVVAERVDLQSTVVTGGGIDSAKKTSVECDLEASNSQVGNAGGFSRIIDLVADGSMVKKGQMIARLDSSGYEELVRQHEILLLQARSNEQKAQLDLKSAEITYREYRDGQLPQLREFHQSQILLYEADIRRGKDRLAWVVKMVVNGYLSHGQTLTEQTALDRSEVNLSKVRGDLSILDRFSSAVQLKRLELAIESARDEWTFQTLQLKNREDQHKKLKKQVAACTMLAPHDGMVIYASTYNPNAVIELGASVYNRMNLFYLPDLTQTEVKIELNESEIRKVRVGQSARIRVNGYSNHILEGHVKSVDQIAMEPKRWWLSREIRNFSTVIAVHSAPFGVMPGMTADVEIKGDIRPSALVVPSTAVSIEKGQEVVYVVGQNRLERRAVGVESGDSQHMEIMSGLDEGEEVILDPSGVDPSEVARF